MKEDLFEKIQTEIPGHDGWGIVLASSSLIVQEKCFSVLVTFTGFKMGVYK